MSYLDVAVYPLKHPLLRLIYLLRHKAIAPGFGTLAKSCWNVGNPRAIADWQLVAKEKRK